jgi:hypothetical protein
VTQVTAALRAANLGANHAVSTIFDVLNGVIVLWLVETWPTAVRVKLGVSFKQKGIATAAMVAASTLLI